MRSFHHSQYEASSLLERKRGAISVVLPAREEAATIGHIVAELRGLGRLVDEVVVIDADSRDGTARIAAAAGAEVHSQSALLPEIGPVQGKGDAMWRALSVVRGDVVVYLDADTRDFGPRFLTGLVGPLLDHPELRLVKGTFRRPYVGTSEERPNEGGRVTELCARPLLAAFYPPLAGFGQPLAGEFAARRSLLDELPFATGYGIEIGMLIDVFELYGLGAMAQVDLGERRNQHQPLFALGAMAYRVLAAVLHRLERDGRLSDAALPPFRGPDGRVVEIDLTERPPFGSLATARGRAAARGAR